MLNVCFLAKLEGSSILCGVVLYVYAVGFGKGAKTVTVAYNHVTIATDF